MEVKYKATCPICGKNLFKGAPGSILEGNCPKCKAFLEIQYTAHGVSTVLITEGLKQ